MQHQEPATTTDASQQHQPARKVYEKPQMQAVQLRVKDDVLAVCRTGSTTQAGGACKITPCFS